MNELYNALLETVIIFLVHHLICDWQAFIEDKEMQEANIYINSHVIFVICDPRKFLK